MSVYKPRGCKVWQIDFWLYGVRYLRSAETEIKATARRAERQWRAEIMAKGRPEAMKRSHGKTFSEMRRDYFELRGSFSTNADALKAQLDVAENIVGAHTAMADIDDHAMLRYRKAFADLPSEKRTAKPGERSPSAINDFTRLILRVYNHCLLNVETQLKPLNPKAWLFAEPWRIRELSKSEESRLRVASEPEIVDVWDFIIETGLRRKPACELRWDQVDVDARTITVIEKGKKPHVVPLSSFALKILKGLEGNHKQFVFTLVCKKTHKYQGVVRAKGERIPLKPSYFWRRLNSALVRASISDFTVHDLRHTAATRLLRVCGNLAVVQKFLGHTTDRETRRYVHMVQEDVASAILMRDIARLSANIPAHQELTSLPVDLACISLRHIHLALALREQLEQRRNEVQREAA